MNFVDSHSHLGDSSFDGDRDEMILRAKDAGVSHIVNICTCPDTLKTGLALREKYPWIHLAAAAHPHDATQEEDPFFPLIEKTDLVAIGEIGLDYFYKNAPVELQKLYLKRYLHLAKERKLPVIIHCREAFADFFKILDSDYDGPGVLHCFTGTIEEAREVIARGWHLSLSGIVTFKKSEALREVAAETPLDRLLIETDAPYLAPQSHRGKRNESAYVCEVAQTIAKAKGLSLEEVASATSQNASKLFGIAI